MNKSVLYGGIAGLGLLALYAVTMTALARSWTAAWEQFQTLWYLMMPLAVGFGIQVGLYTTLKQKTRITLATGGTSAGIGMLACCAHHAADVLPILGLSAVVTLVGQYQKPILVISILINIIGIGIMWQHVRKAV